MGIAAIPKIRRANPRRLCACKVGVFHRKAELAENNHQQAEKMKRIKRTNNYGVKLYEILPRWDGDDCLTVCVTCNPIPGKLFKPTPRIFIGGDGPMFDLARGNVANVIRSLRKQERGGA